MSFDTVLSIYISVAGIKHWPKETQGKNDAIVHITVHYGGKTGGTQDRNLKEGESTRNGGLLACCTHMVQAHLPRE